MIYLLCAGSRDEHIPYCSNICCLGSLRQAIRVKRAHSETRITILFRDLYLLGDESNEQVVVEARQLGIEFIRYAPGEPPYVEQDAVIVRDQLTGLTRRLEYDRLVLATPMVPQDDAGVLARWLHLPRDAHGFFIDPHHRVRPAQQIERGIFVCGSAHQPVDVDTAVLQGMTAAARAARFIRQGEVVRPAASAWVNPELCTGDGHCVSACPVEAITLTPHASLASLNGGGSLDRASIDPFLCLGCGNCVAECPTKAIELPNASDAQIFAQIDAALACLPVYLSTCLPVYPKSLVFACQWSGFSAMELAGARRMSYPANVRVIELSCSARLDPLHVLYALLNGADRVLLALCPPNECHYGNGNRYAEMRIENLRAQLAAHGIDPQRVNCARMMGDDAGAWVQAVANAANVPKVPKGVKAV